MGKKKSIPTESQTKPVVAVATSGTEVELDEFGLPEIKEVKVAEPESVESASAVSESSRFIAGLGPPMRLSTLNMDDVIPKPICIFESLGLPMPKNMSNTNFVFDIETGPQPWSDIEWMVEPFVAPPPFDPSSVKCGDIDRKTKTPEEERQREKEEKINAARRKYEDEAAGARTKWADAITKQSLIDPALGCILAIGYGWQSSDGKQEEVFIDGLDDQPESEMLYRFWCHYLWAKKNRGMLGGHAIANFDVPWNMRRAMRHNIEIPRDILQNDRYLDKMFADTQVKWGCGVWGSKSSADGLAIYFGTRRKVQHTVTGDVFWMHWRDNRPAAIEYLRGDICCEMDLCNVMKVWR